MHIPVPDNFTSLGLTLLWTPLAAAANIWHVLDVAPNSPADLAGLLPYGDYILASPDGVLHGESGLSELVDDYIGRPLRLYVYNNEYNVTREVVIQPSREWGGEGALGCVLGYGALHRLPAPLNEPVSAPGETMFDGEKDAGPSYGGELGGAAAPPTDANAPPSGDLLVPAQMVDAVPKSVPTRSKRKGQKGNNPNKAMMDDYFKEGEEKSRELDNAPTGKGAAVAPPPRAGGPPRAASAAPATSPTEKPSPEE